MDGLDELDMDSASEFLAMAATLLEIKSRAMLPRPQPAAEGEETPEEELIRRLEEYRAIKEACTRMKALEETARELLTKLPEEYPLPPQTYELTGLSLEGLAQAFRNVLELSLIHIEMCIRDSCRTRCWTTRANPPARARPHAAWI